MTNFFDETDDLDENVPDLVPYLKAKRLAIGASAREMGIRLFGESRNPESMVYAIEQGRSDLGARSLGKLLKSEGNSRRARAIVNKYLLKLADTPQASAGSSRSSRKRP